MAAASSQFKICLLGEGRVGKTSILLKFVRDQFNDQQASSMDASYMEKTVTVDGAEHKLSIWDTAGQERFHALTPLYYRDADGALLVYDITDGDSFQRVRDWVKELRKVVGPSIKLAIAGNKCDMLSKRHVSQEVAEAYAKEVGASHTLTSAKTGTGLAEVFQTIAKNMAADPAKANAAQGGTGGRRGGRRGRQKLTLVDSDEEDTKPKTSCC